MKKITIEDIKKITLPKPNSHKGQNGKLLIIGGSRLFHAASLWSLTVASRIVDLVHYCSVPENNQIVHELKKEFRNGIVVPRNDIEEYIEEDDVILLGPGMTRDNETQLLTDSLLKQYSKKQWVIDAGALQMVDPAVIPHNAVLTPHHKEFDLLKIKNQKLNIKNTNQISKIEEQIVEFAKRYNCVVLLKGKVDIASNGEEIRIIEGGNPGMTKGGTGDVLAGLIAGLGCKNDPWNATLAGSFINKRAGDELYERVGPFFNATDLANQIPITMKKILL